MLILMNFKKPMTYIQPCSGLPVNFCQMPSSGQTLSHLRIYDSLHFMKKNKGGAG